MSNCERTHMEKLSMSAASCHVSSHNDITLVLITLPEGRCRYISIVEIGGGEAETVFLVVDVRLA